MKQQSINHCKLTFYIILANLIRHFTLTRVYQIKKSKLISALFTCQEMFCTLAHYGNYSFILKHVNKCVFFYPSRGKCQSQRNFVGFLYHSSVNIVCGTWMPHGSQHWISMVTDAGIWIRNPADRV